MSTPEVDVAALSEVHRQSLEQFTAVTDQPPAIAIPLLKKCQWNAQVPHLQSIFVLSRLMIQIAITRFFDGDADTIDPAAEAAQHAQSLPTQDPPRGPHRDTLMQSLDTSSLRNRRPRLDPAPEISPLDPDASRPAPLVLALIFVPFSFTYSVLTKAFTTLGTLFPLIPRFLSRLYAPSPPRKRLNGQEAAERLLCEIQTQYGVSTDLLPFQQISYNSVRGDAKRDLKYLLMILVSPEHDDTSSFLTQTLFSDHFISFIHSHSHDLLLWLGNVQDAEAYSLSSSLQVTKFPFVGLIANTPSIAPSSMSLITRASGLESPTTLIDMLSKTISHHDPDLISARADKRTQDFSRTVRNETDSAYERSLAIDRERARKKREEEDVEVRVLRHEQDRLAASPRRIQNADMWRAWRRQSLTHAAEGDAVRLSIRLLSGQRLVKKFEPTVSIEEVYATVECHIDSDTEAEVARATAVNDDHGRKEKPVDYDHVYDFRLASTMPRRVFEPDDSSALKDLLGRSGNLIVERALVDDES